MITPANGARIRFGAIQAASTAPSRKAEPVSSTISTGRATISSHKEAERTNVADQSTRKSR